MSSSGPVPGLPHLTLLYTGYFDHFVTSCITQIKQCLVHFLVPDRKVYPCDQVEMENGPNERLLMEQEGFKVGRGLRDHSKGCGQWKTLIVKIMLNNQITYITSNLHKFFGGQIQLLLVKKAL